MGASKVVGIDISEKMLKIANRENSSPKIIYEQLAIEDLSKLNYYLVHALPMEIGGQKMKKEINYMLIFPITQLMERENLDGLKMES